MTTTTPRTEDADQNFWIVAERQEMNSRAVEECEKIQRERIKISQQMKELEQRERHTAAVLGDLSD